MIPRELPDTITPIKLAELIPALWHAYRAVTGKTPTRQEISLLAAWWGLETGWGKSCHCFNLGNAKSRDGDGRCWCFFRCNEIINGRVVWFDPPNPGCRFRAFESIEDGAADWVALIHSQFPEAAAALKEGPDQVARAAKRRGYYTADEAQYTRTLVGCLPIVQRAAIDWVELEHPVSPDPDLAPLVPLDRDIAGEMQERDDLVRGNGD